MYTHSDVCNGKVAGVTRDKNMEIETLYAWMDLTSAMYPMFTDTTYIITDETTCPEGYRIGDVLVRRDKVEFKVYRYDR